LSGQLALSMKNSGIYQIINTVNGNFYIGSSSNLLKRKITHFRDLRKGKHHSIILQRAFNKYGESKFVFNVILNCKKDFCVEFENYFMNLFNPVYNVAKDALAPMKGRTHSPETIEKFKGKIQPKGKDSPLYGKKWSKETREKIISKRTGSKRSSETKKRMSETAKKINSISRIDREKSKIKVIDNDGILYNSLADAASKNDISVATVCDILKGRHFKTRKGKSFKYYGS
jgi:group I intron endonuclease